MFTHMPLIVEWNVELPAVGEHFAAEQGGASPAAAVPISDRRSVLKPVCAVIAVQVVIIILWPFIVRRLSQSEGCFCALNPVSLECRVCTKVAMPRWFDGIS